MGTSVEHTPESVVKEILGDYRAAFYNIVEELATRSTTKVKHFPVSVYEGGRDNPVIETCAYVICEELRARGLVSRGTILDEKDFTSI